MNRCSFCNVLAPNHRDYCSLKWAHEQTAIAAATGTAKTPKAVECEASQSGPKGIAHA